MKGHHPGNSFCYKFETILNTTPLPGLEKQKPRQAGVLFIPIKERLVLGRTLALVLQHCESVLAGDEEMDPKADRKSFKSLAMKLKAAMRAIWDDISGDLFDIG